MHDSASTVERWAESRLSIEPPAVSGRVGSTGSRRRIHRSCGARLNNPVSLVTECVRAWNACHSVAPVHKPARPTHAGSSGSRTGQARNQASDQRRGDDATEGIARKRETVRNHPGSGVPMWITWPATVENYPKSLFAVCGPLVDGTGTTCAPADRPWMRRTDPSTRRHMLSDGFCFRQVLEGKALFKVTHRNGAPLLLLLFVYIKS